MSDQVTIVRPAVEGDYAVFCKLYRELDSHHVAILPEFFQPFEGPVRPRDFFDSRVNDLDKAIFVAETDGELSGLADVQESSSAPYPMFAPCRFALLDGLMVSSAYRGRGIAQELLREVKLWAKSRGLARIQVNVFSKNLEALEFYQKAGFERVSEKWGLELAGEDRGL